MTSLKPMEIKTSDEQLAEGKGTRLLWRYKYFGCLLVPLLLFLAEFDLNIGSGKKSYNVCHEECSVRRELRYEFFQGRDILNTKDLLEQVKDETTILADKLKVDYGEEDYKKIFVSDDGKLRPFVPYGDESIHRLKRKLMIKVLSAQNDLTQKESVFNGCDCTGGDVGLSRDLSIETQKSNEYDDEDSFPPLDMSFGKYIWATGGHSASAAHGNLFNESYTAFMERDLKDIFASIGIDFQGRNYAMGGTTAAGEIAMCWSEIFGDDVDFFSWDYGMMDVGKPLRFMQYAYRGALSAGHPAFMGIRVNMDRGDQEKIIQDLVDSGISIFVQDNQLWSDMRKHIPDTLGLTTNEIDAMPEFVRNFKCDGVFEKGEPFCEIEKYSRDICPDRQGKAPWHPGIKTHALVGHSLALFLIDNLMAALSELIELEHESVETLLSRLLQEEAEVYDEITKLDFKEHGKNLFSWDDSDIDLDPSVFFSGKSMCHTARLPAHTRYLGYLTDTDKVGGPSAFGKETYDVGVEEKYALTNSKTMQLVWTNDNMHQDDCPVAVNVDHKDAFFSNGDGWKSLNFPNKAERSAYNYNPKELQGIVTIAFTTCEWDKCEDTYLGHKDFNGNAKKWKMKINGTPVERLVDIGHKIFLAKSKDGVRFPLSSDDDYKFEIKVDDPSKHVKISSFMVY